jgi:16S rRNA (guanine527-N7)-methyltransferase
MTPGEFQAAADVSRETLDRLAAYLDLLKTWQPKINLVSAGTLADPWRRHMLDSAQLFPLIPNAAASLADLGSGAGFPGLVLSIMGIEGVHLVESDERKSVFLREAARITGAKAKVIHSRIEALSGIAFDVVVARALAPLAQLFDYTAGLLKPEGVAFFLKGANVERELTDAEKTWQSRTQILPSLTDQNGVILRVEALTRVDRRANSR